MTKTNISLSRIYTATAIGTAVLSLILRIVNFFCFYDSSSGYYRIGAVLPVISNCLLALSLIFLLVLGIAKFRKAQVEYPATASPAHYVSAASAAILSVVLAVSDIVIAVQTGDRSYILAFILGLMSALYFLCSAVEMKPAIRIVTGSLALIRILFLLIRSFSDFSVGINTPDKLMFNLACAAAMLFITSELKAQVKAPRPWLCVFSSAAAMILCSVASLPSIIAYHAEALPSKSVFYAEYYIIFGIAIYSAFRFVTTVSRIKEAKEEATADASIPLEEETSNK